MNTLFISHGLYPCQIGGAELFNYYLIKALAKFHKIFVITCCKKKLDLDAIIIRVNPRTFGLRRFSIPLQDFINIVKLRNKIDLVHVSYMADPWFRWLPYPCIKKIFGISYIVSIRGGSMHQWKPKFPHKVLFKNADAIVGVSNEIKKEYEKRIGREVILIPSGLPFIDSKERKWRLRDKYRFESTDTIILFLGRLKKIKGIDVLLSAFIELGKEYIEKHNLKLLFVGEGDTRKDLEERTKRENFNKYVKFLGSIPHEEVSAIYKISDIYIIPSLFEGTSNSMLEAMFNKMPIIGTDTSGINNIIKHKKNGLLFKVKNCNDLKEKIVYLIENRDVGIKLGREARKTYENNYNFEVVVKQYMKLYEKLEKECIRQKN